MERSLDLRLDRARFGFDPQQGNVWCGVQAEMIFIPETTSKEHNLFKSSPGSGLSFQSTCR